MANIVDLTKGEGCVTCHSWNKDFTQVAFSPLNSNLIYIYKKSGSGFEEAFCLTDHDQTVTSIDWGHKTNRIVSASHDRNAYVWRFEDNTWKPTLVILRLEKGCTQVRWNPDESKFAVGSAAKCVSICYFEEQNDWWVSKHVRKPHRSTVLSLAWSPCGMYLATGSSDFKTRVFATFLKGIDKQRPPANGPYGEKAGTFGECLAEYDAFGWVHSVCWSPSGARLAFVAHDSALSVIDIQSGSILRDKTTDLPMRSCVFLSENSVVGAGHGMNPLVFVFDGSAWKLHKRVDEESGGGGAAAAKGPSAMAMFKNKDTMGTDANVTALKTKHQNAIVEVCAMATSGGKASQFSTVGADGKLVIWPTAPLQLK